ncbi:hypothetical protein A1O3_09778 [Capronia epimyces CBS 606.96]|uniref:Uncharacterized protein n=1 Tax=Capronia epimyces CBS 606.96 TaxID=1182542 RepID=W9XKQ2_9EURO|nr:uncharacterized protein A1O3_09778 [Capronia epimyces CBS 606.96]EXJ77551.1 hypothetical protein A1O3_09778 [Capronia epimyces CBS 606.96]
MQVLPILLTAAATVCSSAWASSGAQFRVFDNTAYVNTTIGYGTTNINWIPNYVCHPLVQGGVLPAAEAWKSAVREWNIYPGYPLVLDCEDLYFKNASTADLNLHILSALQTWADEVVSPGQIIGWYGLSGNTLPTLYDHYRSLIANHSAHAFFPSAYTFTSNLSSWNSSLNSVVQTIKTIDDSLPIWPYTWPQYHNNYTFLPVDLWKSELQLLQARRDIDGFVIWGGKNHAVCNDTCQATAGQQPWLNATRTYLATLYGLYTGQAERSGAQVFS